MHTRLPRVHGNVLQTIRRVFLLVGAHTRIIFSFFVDGCQRLSRRAVPNDCLQASKETPVKINAIKGVRLYTMAPSLMIVVRVPITSSI